MKILILSIAFLAAIFVWLGGIGHYKALDAGSFKKYFLPAIASVFIFILITVSGMFITEPESNIANADISQQEEPKIDKPVQAKEIAGLGITSSDFISKFKDIANESDLKVNFNNVTTTDGDAKKIINYTLSKHLALLVTTEKTSDVVTDIIVIGVGDGARQSGDNIILGFIAAIAATNPDLSKAARGDVLKSLGLLSKRDDNSESTIRNGIKYTLARSESIGTWLIIAREKENI